MWQVLDSEQERDTHPCGARQQLVEKKEIPYRSAVASSDVKNNSAVLRWEYGRFSVLLTGDMEHEGEEALLASSQLVDSLILKVPHHGGDNALTAPFLQAVNPQLGIISVGWDNHLGHPGQPTLEKLRDVPIHRTDQLGNVGG
jgi:competence protein ComEC